MIYVAGPGHGGPALVANTYLEGTYSEFYPQHLAGRGRDEALVQAVFLSGWHPQPCCARKRRARFMKAANSATALVACVSGRSSTIPICSWRCVIGDGEAETGPLAASWHSNKFLNPVRDGAVLPILHLNGYKIANPTRAGAHSTRGTRESLRWATATSRISSKATSPRHDAPTDGRDARYRRSRDPGESRTTRARTGFKQAPALADDRSAHAQGLDRTEGGGRQEDRRLVALASGAAWRHAAKPEHVQMLEEWMRSYRPEELFDEDRSVCAPNWQTLAPNGQRRMGANPHANGGAAAQRTAAAGLSRLRGRGASARHG